MFLSAEIDYIYKQMRKEAQDGGPVYALWAIA